MTIPTRIKEMTMTTKIAEEKGTMMEMAIHAKMVEIDPQEEKGVGAAAVTMMQTKEKEEIAHQRLTG